MLIALCVVQSGIFSGLNLALMGISRLQLEVEAQAGDQASRQILHQRQDTHRLLATILWGNVGTNTLLAFLMGDAVPGLLGFITSVVLITLIGEIVPQAYLNKNLKKVYKYLNPMVYFYSYLFYPIAWPTGRLLDKLVGKDGLTYYRENEMRQMLKYHASDEKSEISQVEAIGAMNFLKLDDLPVCQEGKVIDPDSIIIVETAENGHIAIPNIIDKEHPFVQEVVNAGQPWVILVDSEENLLLTLDVDEFLREVLNKGEANIYYHCHRPIIVTDRETTLEQVLPKFAIEKIHGQDDVVDDDVVIYWTPQSKKIITGADIFGTLIRGISKRK